MDRYPVFAQGDAEPFFQEKQTSCPKPERIKIIESTCSSKFIEDAERIQSCKEYPRTQEDPGLIVIFNQHSFDSPSIENRMGTNHDVNEAILTFGRLGYNIKARNIHNDFTRGELIKELDTLSQADHTNRNCFIFIMLTHGSENDMLHTKDAPVYVNEIWEPFSEDNCPTLKDKPKFFIFQACKGHLCSYPETATGPLVPRCRYTAPLEADFLIAFSAVEETCSMRNIVHGTWFIQELCKNFSAYGRRDDVISLLIRTTKCVANGYFYIQKFANEDEADSKRIKKQMPIFVSTLTKKFYLTKSKDRNLVLNVIENQKDILNGIKELHNKIDEIAKSIKKY